jgi:DNA repair protein RadC
VLDGREIGQTEKSRHNAGTRNLRDFATTMRIYDAKIQYHLVQEGPQEVLNTAEKIVGYMAGAFDEAPVAEMFYVVCLSRKNRPLGRHRVTVGTATAALAHPREVFRAAILANACAIVCVHNHPSGDPVPSGPDLTLTRILKDASKTIEIEMLDHVIIGNKDDDPLGLGYYSFRNAGLI